MQEAGVVLGYSQNHGYPIFWHVPDDSRTGSLPDSRTLWEVLWTNRNDIWGFAHSHPGSGIPRPSSEDLGTFRAIESALGKSLHWYIASSDCLTFCHDGLIYKVDDTPPWLETLRTMSNYSQP